MTYPDTDFDRPDRLQAQLGSVWESDYADRDVVTALAVAQNLLAAQVYQDMSAAVDTISPAALPVWHIEDFYIWEILQSESQTETVGVSFAAPSGLNSVPLIADKLTAPTVSWSEGIDHYVQDGRIYFRQDPFLLLPGEPVLSSSSADLQLTMCLSRPSFDRDLVYNHLGYVLGVRANNSEQYKRLLNLLADALVRGASQTAIEQAVATIYDIPLTLTDGEIVDEIAEDSRYRYVITDRNVYRHHLDATISVVEGQTLRCNQSQSNAYTKVWPGMAIPGDITSLTLPVRLLDATILDSLTFENAWYTPTVSGTAGFERVEFPVVGDPDDVEMFWDLVYANGQTSGASFHQLLLASGGIPAVINPMLFVLQNVLRNHGLVVYINTLLAGDRSLPLDAVATLQSYLPAKTMLLLQLMTT